MLVKVIQVFPQKDYKIYVYFTDGKVKLYDASHLAGKGVFKALENMDFYFSRCTVLNGTLAWDVSGTYDPANCIDVDPITLYNESIEVEDPLKDSA